MGVKNELIDESIYIIAAIEVVDKNRKYVASTHSSQAD